MSIENVKEYFKKFKKDNEILEFETSSATVELASKGFKLSACKNMQNTFLSKLITNVF